MYSIAQIKEIDLSEFLNRITFVESQAINSNLTFQDTELKTGFLLRKQFDRKLGTSSFRYRTTTGLDTNSFYRWARNLATKKKTTTPNNDIPEGTGIRNLMLLRFLKLPRMTKESLVQRKDFFTKSIRIEKLTIKIDALKIQLPKWSSWTKLNR